METLLLVSQVLKEQMFKFGCNSIKQTDAFDVLGLNPQLTETDNGLRLCCLR